ncbi:MAG: metalloregulator ArsR/SmtB family transcription factor [Haloarculaceae archaeon]
MTDADDALYERHAEFCKMFSNPKRLRILHLLKDGEYNVGEISDETGIPQPTVSQHLRKMREQGVVSKRGAGLNNYYSVADDRIVDGMNTMREVLLDRMGDDVVISEQNS